MGRLLLLLAAPRSPGASETHAFAPARQPGPSAVREATAEELADLHEQERLRFLRPHKPFTYVMRRKPHAPYNAIVAPVKGAFDAVG